MIAPRQPASRVPRHAPRAIGSTADLRQLQRLMLAAVCRPLGRNNRTRRRWSDGRTTAAVVGEFTAANDRLSALDRIEIYNRMYWFRVLDSVLDDCPGLHALLGPQRFWRLARAYLERHPSRTFTLRNLCRHLPRFIAAEPRLTTPRTVAARDLALFEWAQIVAFDSAALRPVALARLRAADPARLRLALQPCLTLLRLDHAVDDYLIAVKERDRALRTASSQTVIPQAAAAVPVAASWPRLRRERVHLAIHRHDNQIYSKRLGAAEFRLLRALAAGRTLSAACAAAFRASSLPLAEQVASVRGWFRLWSRLHWLCPRL
jgi:hypothetical protein